MFFETIRNQRDLARDALKQRNEHFMNLQADYEKVRKDFDVILLFSILALVYD